MVGQSLVGAGVTSKINRVILGADAEPVRGLLSLEASLVASGVSLKRSLHLMYMRVPSRVREVTVDLVLKRGLHIQHIGVLSVVREGAGLLLAPKGGLLVRSLEHHLASLCEGGLRLPRVACRLQSRPVGLLGSLGASLGLVGGVGV